MTLYGCAARIAPFFRAVRYTISPLYLRKVYDHVFDIQLRNQNVKFYFVYRQQRGYIKLKKNKKTVYEYVNILFNQEYE